MGLAIELIIFLCECLMQLLCVNAYLNKKLKINIKTISFVIIYVLSLVIIEYLHLPTMLTLLSQFIILLYVIFILRIKVIHSLIVVLINFLTCGSLQLLSLLPVYIIVENNSDLLSGLLINIISLLLMVLLTHFIKINKFYIKMIAWDRTIISCMALCVFLYLFLFVRFKTKNELVVVAYFISAVMIFIVIGVAFMWQRDRYKVKQKNLELHMHELYGKTVEGMIENIRIRQHDFKNQLAAIYGMHLTAENFEELVEGQKEYCDYLMKESRYDTILTKCKDKILAGFLYTKFTECEKKGIEISFDILVNDSQCRLATYGIIELVGILLDNAMEYEIEHIEEKGIYFKIQDEQEKIKIVCRNKVEYIPMETINKFFAKGFSSKGEGRGLGLYNVKKMMEGKGDIIVSNEIIKEENWLQFQININRN